MRARADLETASSERDQARRAVKKLYQENRALRAELEGAAGERRTLMRKVRRMMKKERERDEAEEERRRRGWEKEMKAHEGRMRGGSAAAVTAARSSNSGQSRSEDSAYGGVDVRRSDESTPLAGKGKGREEEEEEERLQGEERGKYRPVLLADKREADLRASAAEAAVAWAEARAEADARETMMTVIEMTELTSKSSLSSESSEEGGRNRDPATSGKKKKLRMIGLRGRLAAAAIVAGDIFGSDHTTMDKTKRSHSRSFSSLLSAEESDRSSLDATDSRDKDAAKEGSGGAAVCVPKATPQRPASPPPRLQLILLLLSLVYFPGLQLQPGFDDKGDGGCGSFQVCSLR